MTISVTMLAPVAGGAYIGQSGTTYTADANRLIVVTNTYDIISLTKFGCTIANEPNPQVTQANSSSPTALILGATNLIPTSSFATPFTIPAPTVLGQRIGIVNQSTGVPTMTVSSLATVYTEKAAAVTVLTGGAAGVAELEAIGSTQWQIKYRSGGTSSAGAAFAFNITSS